MISFVHTSAVHVPVFDKLLDAIHPGMARAHQVRENWLDEVRANGLGDELAQTIRDEISALSTGGVGVCTCSSIGSAAEMASSAETPVIRIDRVLMEAALSHGSSPLVAMCLESTREPTMQLLFDVAAKAGAEITPDVVMCEEAWEHFEAGDMEAYTGAVAGHIRHAVDKKLPSCIVLAQASMAASEEQLNDLGLPVLSSPRLGVERAVSLLNT